MVLHQNVHRPSPYPKGQGRSNLQLWQVCAPEAEHAGNSRHLTWRVVKSLLVELDAEPQQPSTKSQQKSREFAIHFSRNTKNRQHPPRHYWGRWESSLIPICSNPLLGQAQGKSRKHWEMNTLHWVTSVMRHHTENCSSLSYSRNKAKGSCCDPMQVLPTHADQLLGRGGWVHFRLRNSVCLLPT